MGKLFIVARLSHIHCKRRIDRIHPRKADDRVSVWSAEHRSWVLKQPAAETHRFYMNLVLVARQYTASPAPVVKPQGAMSMAREFYPGRRIMTDPNPWCDDDEEDQ